LLVAMVMGLLAVLKMAVAPVVRLAMLAASVGAAEGREGAVAVQLLGGTSKRASPHLWLRMERTLELSTLACPRRLRPAPAPAARQGGGWPVTAAGHVRRRLCRVHPACSSASSALAR
jgi:hypothetical protein